MYVPRHHEETSLPVLHALIRAHPWKVSDAPVDFIERLLSQIVGIEIPIAKLVGKWKVSQNRPASDRLGVVAGLLDRGDARSKEMASLVNRHVALDDG
jgi:transcriptional regulator